MYIEEFTFIDGARRSQAGNRPKNFMTIINCSLDYHIAIISSNLVCSFYSVVYKLNEDVRSAPSKNLAGNFLINRSLLSNVRLLVYFHLEAFSRARS